jgi:hypothetical protein
MPESIRERYSRWGLEDLLLRHPRLRVVPSRGDGLALAGSIHFRVRGPTGEVLEDEYRIELLVPSNFPADVPSAWETGGRIPPNFHKLDDGSLCLGAPTALVLTLGLSPTLITFVEGLLIPYLFGYSHFVKHGDLPYGELDHGADGLLQHFGALFGTSDRTAAREFVRLTSVRKRRANKQPCPCNSGRRLGKCHNRRVNRLRDRLGRVWFRDCHVSLAGTRK